MIALSSRHPCRILASVALAFLLAGQAGAEESLAGLFAKVSSAYGAKAPAALRETGKTTSFRRGEGSLLRLLKAPDRFRIDIAYASGSESRALLGAQSWLQGQPANPAMRGAIVLQAARLALPWNLLARRGAAVDLGTVSGSDGKTLRAVELPLDAELKLIVEIDPATGHMLRSRGIQVLGGNTLEFATIYSDFTRAGGHLFAASEQHYAMGMHIGHSRIERYEVLDTLPDSAFAP